MKKILSLVLVIALVLGSFSFAFAVETPSDVVGTDCEDAVELLMALGIVNGYEDGTYKPAKVVTRAEMAKLLIIELGYGDLVGGTTSFSDTQGHWAEDYISLAAGLGLVNGYPDGTFRPDNIVTFDEAITMAVRALGYTDASLTGTWPTNYKIKALNLDLLDDVDVSAGGADRCNVANMLENLLFLTYGEVNADDEWVENTDDDGDAKKIIDKVGAKEEEYQITYKDVYGGSKALDSVIDLEPYLYHIVDYYENADGDVAFIDKVYTSEMEMDKLDYDGDEIYSGEDKSDKEVFFDIDYVADFAMFNYGEIGYEELDDYVLDDDEYDNDVTVTVIYADSDDFDGTANDGDDDGKYDANEAVAVIAKVVTKTVLVKEDYDKWDTYINAAKGGDIDLPEDDDNDFDDSRLVVMGDVDAVEDIEEDDVVEVYEPYDLDLLDEEGDDLVLLVTRDTVEGEVEEHDGDDGVVIDGVELDYADDFDGDVLGNEELGDDYIAYLNQDGDISFLEELSGGPTAEDFAVVVDIANGNTDDSKWDPEDIDVDDAPQVKLLTADNDIVVYDITTDDFDFELGEPEMGEDAVTLGSLVLEWNGETTGTITVSGISVGDIVLYGTDSDGDIDEILQINSGDLEEDYELMDCDGDDYDEPVLAGGYLVEDSTIVFDLTAKDSDDWEVIDADQLDMADDAYVEFVTEDGDNDVVVMSTDDNDMTEDGIYALITKVTMALQDGDPVQKLVGFVDGETDVLYTDDDDDFDDEYVDEYIIELTMDGDEVESTTVEAADFEGMIVSISGNFVKVDDVVEGEIYREISDEVVVYEITYDVDDHDVDEVTVAEYGDLDEDGYVFFYDTDNEFGVDGDDAEIDIIIYISEKEYGQSHWSK